jgi:hypothetical protein
MGSRLDRIQKLNFWDRLRFGYNSGTPNESKKEMKRKNIHSSRHAFPPTTTGKRFR